MTFRSRTAAKLPFLTVVGEPEENAGRIVRLVPGPVIAADGGGRVLDLSSEAARILGREPVVPGSGGPSLGDLLPGLDLPETPGVDHHGELELTRDGGGTVAVRVTARRTGTGPESLITVLLEDRTNELAALEDARTSRWFLEETGEITGLGIFDWDLKRDRSVWSDEVYRVFGYEPGAFTPTFRRFLDLFHPEDRHLTNARVLRVLSGKAPANYHGRAIREDGSIVRIEIEARVIRGRSGRVERAYGVIADVTARRETELDRARLKALFRCSLDGLVIKDEEGRVTALSPAGEQVYGQSEAEAMGRLPEELMPAPEARENQMIMDRLEAGESDQILFEATRTRPDGSRRPFAISVATFQDSQGRMAGTVASMRDLSKIESARALPSDRDPLTGLHGGLGFTKFLDDAIAAGGGALLFVDLDNMKLINEFHGYQTGDSMLRGVAQTLDRECGEKWPLARVGGDEFAVLLPGVDPPTAERAAERALRLVRGYVEPAGEHPVTVTASIGVATFRAGGNENPTEVISRASRAADRAKQRGRDSWVLADPDSIGPGRIGPGERAWGERVRRILADGRIDLHLQPITDVASGEILMHEVLLRIIEGDEPRAPGPYLEMAERLGLVHAIDRAVMRKAIDLLEANPGLTLSVNVSGGSIGDDQLLELIREAVELHRFDPTGLVIELTETATVIDAGRAYHFASALEEIGCSFAIDDFGTGYGSYDYLRNMPADYVKIDGQFIREWTEVDQAVIASLVGLARGLGKRTVAECVESQEILERVADAGIDLAQGYHLGRPAPVSSVLGESGERQT